MDILAYLHLAGKRGVKIIRLDDIYKEEIKPFFADIIKNGYHEDNRVYSIEYIEWHDSPREIPEFDL